MHYVYISTFLIEIIKQMVRDFDKIRLVVGNAKFDDLSLPLVMHNQKLLPTFRMESESASELKILVKKLKHCNPYKININIYKLNSNFESPFTEKIWTEILRSHMPSG